MPRGRPPKNQQTPPTTETYLQKVSREVSSNQSRLSLILGALIILVVGILVFNYFNKSKTDLGPAQQTQQVEEQDVSPDKLPGKYTVKEGDTLFLIAEKYYQDGAQFEEIAKANNLSNVDVIETGQVLAIPSPSPSLSASPQPSPTPAETSDLGTGGADTTIWGPKIEATTYTVQEGDWLSKIAGRAYGDIFTYQKLAQVNNISNPDLIFPGQVLTIPR